MKCIALVFVLFAAASWGENPKKVAADYGKEITTQMVPTKDDPKDVQRQKCDHLASLLIDSQYGDEDLTEVSDDVLKTLRTTTVCAVIALNDKDIDRLVTVMSLQTDVSNELLRRISIYAEDEEKKYSKLEQDYKTLLAFQVTRSATPAARTAGNHCAPAVETQIEGDFNGWDDEVIYKMTNGEIWQQENYHYHYHYAYRPSVVIYSTSAGCHIKVEDDDDEGVDVLRIK